MKFYRKIIRSLISNLSPKDQKKGICVIILIAFNALIDFFSLSAFVPLLILIVNPEVIESNLLAKRAYVFLGAESQTHFVIVCTISVLFTVLLKNWIGVGVAKTKAHYAFTIRTDLASRALKNYMQQNYLDFVAADYTREVNIIANYPLTFSNNIIIPVTTIISEALVFILIITCMMYYDFKIILLVLLISLPVYLLFQLRKKNLEKISNELKTIYPLTLKHAQQAVEGFSEIKIYRRESFFYQQFQRASEKLTNTFIRDQMIQSGTVRLTEIIAASIICMLIMYAAIIHQDYRQTLVLLGIYAGASFRIIPSINRILNALQQIRTHEYLLEEFKITMSQPTFSQKSTHITPVFNKAIVLKNISFHYSNGVHPLKDISLTINKGEKVAITGGSGEGKTTFLLILLGFLRETNGEFLIDGVYVQSKDAWKTLIGYVPQNPYIIDGTIAENIGIGIPNEQMDNSRINQLIMELGLEDVVRNLPNGIDTRIGERGAKLSGGQRQRLALARALYIDAEILLLDEVTNQVHASLELEIMNLLHRIAGRRRTIIMVTHKVHPGFFDTVYHLKNGRLNKN